MTEQAQAETAHRSHRSSHPATTAPKNKLVVSFAEPKDMLRLRAHRGWPSSPLSWSPGRGASSEHRGRLGRARTIGRCPMGDAQIWGALARRYDILVRLFDTSYPAIRGRLAHVLSGRERVLEVAAGTGQFTPDLAQTASSGVATDVAPEMVEQLSRRLEGLGLGDVELAVMSAYERPRGALRAASELRLPCRDGRTPPGAVPRRIRHRKT
jgi:hypothetical protein